MTAREAVQARAGSMLWFFESVVEARSSRGVTRAGPEGSVSTRRTWGGNGSGGGERRESREENAGRRAG